MLNTFQLVNKNKVISPILTTTREYGRWFEDVFDNYTSQQELYIRAIKQDGNQVMEWHPGTRIGTWFDKSLSASTLTSETLKSWFILQDSPMLESLVKLKLAEKKDAIPISVNDFLHRRMLRVYTAEQIELYIKSMIDKQFSIAPYITTPKQVIVKDTDFDKLIMPKFETKRKKLF